MDFLPSAINCEMHAINRFHLKALDLFPNCGFLKIGDPSNEWFIIFSPIQITICCSYTFFSDTQKENPWPFQESNLEVPTCIYLFICLFIYLFISIYYCLFFFSAKCLRYHRFLQFYSVQYVLGTGNGHFFWLEWLRPQAKKVAYRWPPTQTTWAGWICRSWMESGEILVFVDHIQCLSMFFLHGPHVWELNSPCLIVKSAIYNHHVCLWCPFLWPL